MILIPGLLLISLSIAVIYTSSPTLAIQQAIFAAVGVVLFFIIRNFDFRTIFPMIKPLYFFILASLILVFIINVETRGSVRWIPLGPFNFQPSEFAKISIILALASFWATRIPTWRNIVLSLAIITPFLVLIFRQPDLGTTLTVGFIWLSILFAANINFLKMFLISTLGLVLAPLIWILLKDYQKQRITSFLFPTQDPLGIGYNVIQSTIAVGSGQFWGRGLGRGTQSRLQFLPEFRTDFIFAFIAEELGFLGSIVVLILYSAMFFLLFKFMSNINSRFGELIIVGVAATLFFQILVNIGMNIGLLPITGITLPLLSYGGSSVITTFILLGLVASISKFGLRKKEIDTFSFT